MKPVNLSPRPEREDRGRKGQAFGSTKGEFKGFGPYGAGLHDNLNTADYQLLTGPRWHPAGSLEGDQDLHTRHFQGRRSLGRRGAWKDGRRPAGESVPDNHFEGARRGSATFPSGIFAAAVGIESDEPRVAHGVSVERVGRRTAGGRRPRPVADGPAVARGDAPGAHAAKSRLGRWPNRVLRPSKWFDQERIPLLVDDVLPRALGGPGSAAWKWRVCRFLDHPRVIPPSAAAGRSGSW